MKRAVRKGDTKMLQTNKYKYLIFKQYKKYTIQENKNFRTLCIYYCVAFLTATLYVGSVTDIH